MDSKLKWGIISTGAIARTLAAAIGQSKTGELVAVASRTQGSADRFGDEFGIGAGHRYADYAALLEDDDVQAVYIATPHPWHAEWGIKAAAARKHVLVEKPIGVSRKDAAAIFEAGRLHKVLVMEAFMYRCHPQTRKLVELVKDRVIGEVRLIQATFSYRAEFDPQSRIYNKELGGGGILDIGCYPASMVRLIAGAVIGKDFADPVVVKAVGHLESSGVDGYAAAVLKFPADVVGQISCGISVGQENIVRIFGTKGNILVSNPWMANRVNVEAGNIVVQRADQAEAEVIHVPANSTSFGYEVDAFAEGVWAGRTEAAAPAMSWGDSLGSMRTLDEWRAQIGMVYQSDGA